MGYYKYFQNDIEENIPQDKSGVYHCISCKEDCHICYLKILNSKNKNNTVLINHTINNSMSKQDIYPKHPVIFDQTISCQNISENNGVFLIPEGMYILTWQLNVNVKLVENKISISLIEKKPNNHDEKINTWCTTEFDNSSILFSGGHVLYIKSNYKSYSLINSSTINLKLKNRINIGITAANIAIMQIN